MDNVPTCSFDEGGAYCVALVSSKSDISENRPRFPSAEKKSSLEMSHVLDTNVDALY